MLATPQRETSEKTTGSLASSASPPNVATNPADHVPGSGASSCGAACPCTGRGAHGDPNASLAICSCPAPAVVGPLVLGEYLYPEDCVCIGCSEDYDARNVPAIVSVHGRNVCRDHAREWASDEEIEAALAGSGAE